MRSALWREVLVVLLFFLLTIGMMGPVALAPRTTVIGWLGDNVQYVYAVGWMAQALLLGHSPFIDPRMNYPEELYLATTDLPYVSQIIVAPATWLLGPIFGYNLIVFLSFFLSGFFTYLWIRHITDSRLGGLIAGIIFLLTPYRVAHSFGHLQLTATYAIPLIFWALDSFLRTSKLHWRHWLFLAIATWLVGGNSQYYLVICVFGIVMYTLFSLSWHAWRTWLLRSIIAATSVAIGAIISALPYLWAMDSRSFVRYNIEETRIWSASPANFLLPSPYHPLWGEMIAQWRPEPLWIEKALYLSFCGLVLSGVALLWGRHRLKGRGPAWLAVASIGLILALGTDLHLANEPLHNEAPFWLPAYYMSVIPGIELMRVWSRFGLLTIFFVALLAGVGATELLRRCKPMWQLGVAGLLVLLLLIELLPGALPTATLQPRDVDQWLATQPVTTVTAALPTYHDGVNYRVLFGSIYHARHMPSYMHPAHIPPAYRDFATRAQDFPAISSLMDLRELGLDYLLLESHYYNNPYLPPWSEVSAKLAAAGVPVVATLDGVVIIDLRVLDNP